MDAITLIQTLIAAVGFLAVIYQLRQVEKSVRSATRSTIYNLASQVKQNLIDNPDLRPFFHEGKVISEEHKDFDRVMAVATSTLFTLKRSPPSQKVSHGKTEKPGMSSSRASTMVALLYKNF